jgi:hypothetical protein
VVALDPGTIEVLKAQAARQLDEHSAHSTQAEHLFRRKPNSDSARSRTLRSEATRLLF